MKSTHARNGVMMAAALSVFILTGMAAFAAEYRIEIAQVRWELKPGLTTVAWAYGGTVPGTPIIVRPGERVKVEVVNRLPDATNIHWHGLVLPNDQDGPFLEIGPGAAFSYDFSAGESGTYWYHPHMMPVLPQLDRGLYAPFIILAPEDGRYSGDHTYILDDWLLDVRGRRLEGVAAGEMERFGNVETVNGKTDEAIEPLVLKSGELHKLRFINASTAAVHTLLTDGPLFRVTHTDGHPLGIPYLTDRIVLAPGERIDAELFASGKEGDRFRIVSTRADLGIAIPVIYGKGRVPEVASPFVPPDSANKPTPSGTKPDFTLELSTAMGMMGGGMMGGGSMDHGMGGGGMGGGGSGMTRWTINGRSFPATEVIEVIAGKAVTMRFYNKDTMSLMMGHRMDHPMHIHGTKFRVLSINGTVPKGEIWKDTIPVPAGGWVDIAFVMQNPGDWVLHCHVIDHEDGGMMAIVRAR